MKGGEIDEGPNRSRNRNLAADITFGFGQLSAPVHADTGAARAPSRRDRNVDRSRPGLLTFIADVRICNPPESGRTVMAQQRVGPTRENRSAPPSEEREPRPSNGVDASPESVKPSACDPVVDLGGAEPRVQQLASCHVTVLARSEPPDLNGIAKGFPAHMRKRTRDPEFAPAALLRDGSSAAGAFRSRP
jgi:hypothetical protein